MPSIANVVECAVNDECNGIQCCINLDFKIAQLMLNTWFTVDLCQFSFSVGFENWSKEYSMFAFDWGFSGEDTIGSFLTVKLVYFTSPKKK